MRPTRPDRNARYARGVTLVELVVAMVVLGIIAAVAIYFLLPVRQAADIGTRAELTDIADNALQRIGREVRLALPNSVRVTTASGETYLEFLAVRTAGRYRSDVGSISAGSDCPADGAAAAPNADQLSFDVTDTCFKSVGPVLDGSTVVAGSDKVVLNNYGPGFPGQNAYEWTTASLAGTNIANILTRAVEAGPPARLRLTFEQPPPAANPATFQRTLHESPGKRFFVISGPVTFKCNASGQIERFSGYAIQASQPTGTLSGGARIADNVTNCNFDYDASGVGPQVGLLTIRLTLSKTLSGGASETVRLYHAVHVSNVP